MPGSGLFVPGGMPPASAVVQPVVQVPQWFGSLVVSAQTGPASDVQVTSGVSHEDLQTPFEHTWPPAHTFVHEPQCFGSVFRSYCGHPASGLTLASDPASGSSVMAFAQAAAAQTAKKKTTGGARSFTSPSYGQRLGHLPKTGHNSLHHGHPLGRKALGTLHDGDARGRFGDAARVRCSLHESLGARSLRSKATSATAKHTYAIVWSTIGV